MNHFKKLPILLKDWIGYNNRVASDVGTQKNPNTVRDYIMMCKQNGMYDAIKFGFLSDGGGKLRTSGANQFWTKAYSLVTPQARYGEELITNQADREFSSDTGWWSKGSSWTISGGKANRTSEVSTSSIYKMGLLTIGKKYKVELDAIIVESGTLGIYGGGTFGIVSSTGHKSYTLTATSTDLYFSSTSNFIGSIDNISVVEVINSLDGSPTDATQTTSTSQPYLSGNIAPNEKIGLKNPNGGSNYMTHPTISFTANEAWSVTTVVNWSGLKNSSPDDLWGNYLTTGRFEINRGVGITPQFKFTNSTGSALSTISYSTSLIGKSKIITVVANGLNSLSIYVNGVLYEIIPIETNISLNSFFKGYSIDNTRILQGSIYSHIIRAQALTPSQVAAEANFLRSLYPEIPSVAIGSQVWATSNCDMVATPQGNLIQNVTANTNVEKITNAADREFSSDTGFWTKAGETIIAGGVCNIKSTIGDYSDIHKTNLLTVDKWYKFTYTIVRRASGSLSIDGLGSSLSITSTIGTYTYYLKAIGASLAIKRNGITDIDIDDVSIQEVGWSDSTNLYNAIYAATSGTDEQKTYAAVKAAAMWCYYSNDVALGSVYGKLYNWYAAKLLQMDIDYYNTANPTTPWGWRVPTDTDFNTLVTALGGASVAGGKMKKDGVVYWNNPNTGADNSTGFSALPGGYRNNSDGTFTVINTSSRIWSLTQYACFCTNNDAVLSIISQPSLIGRGYGIRLIKS